MRKLVAAAVIGVLSMLGVATVALQSASAGGTVRHIAGAPEKPPADQIVLVGICFKLPTLQHDMGQAVSAYHAHKGMPEAGLWVNNQFYSGNDWAQLDKVVCVVATPPTGVPTPPIVTTTTAPPETTTTAPEETTTTAPEHPCPYDVADCSHHQPVPCLLPFNDSSHWAAGNYGGQPATFCEPGYPGHELPPPECPPGEFPSPHGDQCVPEHPIVTTTTVPVVTTLPVTTTVPSPPTTRCVIVRRVQICTLPHETTTTVEQTTTTEAPTTSTTVEETTTTEAPTTTTTAPPETPCQGIDDCNIVCNDAAGVDDCNICIGNGSCDVIVCPTGYEVDSNGSCDEVPAPPIVTTTTVAPETTTTEAPTTTSTEETTTTAAPVPLSVPCHDKSWCKSS